MYVPQYICTICVSTLKVILAYRDGRRRSHWRRSASHSRSAHLRLRLCLAPGPSLGLGPAANILFPNDISIAPPTMTYSPPSCQLTFRYSYAELTARGVALTTDEAPKIPTLRLAVWRKLLLSFIMLGRMYCNVYTLQTVGGNQPSLSLSLSLVTVHVDVFHCTDALNNVGESRKHN